MVNVLKQLLKHLRGDSKKAVLAKEEAKVAQRFDVLASVKREVEIYKINTNATARKDK
jgi:hypothetical protein